MKFARLHTLILTILVVFCGTSFATSSGQQKAVEVPFSYEDGQIYVPVWLSGMETIYPMLLVTGDLTRSSESMNGLAELRVVGDRKFLP